MQKEMFPSSCMSWSSFMQHYMCSREVNLTEEEKEILKDEGLPIPTTLPLTKVQSTWVDACESVAVVHL